jgi:hypothetical protein
MMSPNMFVATTTSYHSGFVTSHCVKASTIAVSFSISGYSFPIGGRAALARAANFERFADDARRTFARDDARVDADLLDVPRREDAARRRVHPFGVLADDDHVDFAGLPDLPVFAVDAVRDARVEPDGPDVRVEIELRAIA